LGKEAAQMGRIIETKAWMKSTGGAVVRHHPPQTRINGGGEGDVIDLVSRGFFNTIYLFFIKS
jgi:hypothetical protein